MISKHLERRIGKQEDVVDFAMSYIGNAPRLWNSASPEKQMYQHMIFPDGLPYDLKEKKFGTARMGPLYTLATIKKEPSSADDSLLVNHLKSNWNHILSEVMEWYDLLRGMSLVRHIPAGSGI